MPLSLEERVKLLSMVNVFEPLSRDELEELAHLAHDTHLGQGEDLHIRQAGGGKLYALKEGRVQLYVALPNHAEITLSVVEGGSIFGEMALTGDQLGEEVSARALVPSLVCTLKTEDVKHLIESNPQVGLAMVRMLSERLREEGALEVVERCIHLRDHKALEREAEARPAARNLTT